MGIRSLTTAAALTAAWMIAQPGFSAPVATVADFNQQRVIVAQIVERNGVLSGEISNRSQNEVRDVVLLVRRQWRWKDEFHPGDNDPGTAAYQRIDEVIPPGGSISFSIAPMTTPVYRSDGEFKSEITVAGFTEIFRR